MDEKKQLISLETSLRLYWFDKRYGEDQYSRHIFVINTMYFFRVRPTVNALR